MTSGGTLDVDPAVGLTAQQVADRVAAGQVNDVPPTPTRTVAQILRANILTRFNALLGAMFVLILLIGHVRDALFGLVLVINALIGIYQELRAKRTLDRLSVITAPKAAVVREGRVTVAPPSALVRDDVVVLEPGSQVVIDGEVVTASGLEVDESLLTGESEPAAKRVGDLVMSGSFVAAGSGRYRATRIGAEAYAVRIVEEARRFTLTRSELRAGIDRILRYITWAIVPLAAFLFVSQFRAQDGWRGAIAGAVAGTVAMVPEGLVLLTSVAFSLAVMRLARRRVVVQELPAVEALARVDVLCIDKTGTLTEGRLAVDRIERLRDGCDPGPVLAALAAADPAPNATMLAIREAFPEVSNGWAVVDATPFSSARRWSGATFEGGDTWVLGAPEAFVQGGAVRARVETATGAGLRALVLAAASHLEGDRLPTGLEPEALVVLSDRIRPSAADTLRYFAEQGVTVKVLSGDAPTTVGAIAARLSLEGAERPVDASTLDDDATLGATLEAHSVFGRVAPHRKQAMVRALQARGHTVAMTGDGVNDTLALKAADLGIAMGSGADATRAVAQLVLLDSTFDALPAVVGEGRRVLGNIERTSNLYLTKTVYAMLLAIAVGAANMVFPFLPRHLTLIGTLTIGIPSFFLALAPSAQRFRPGFVGRVLRFTVPAGTLAAVATFLGYQLATRTPGVTIPEAQTTAVMTLMWVGLLVLSIVAAPLNAWRLTLVWAMGLAAVIAFVWPVTEEFFALDPPPPTVWLASIGIAALTWSFARLFVPEERPVGTRWRSKM